MQKTIQIADKPTLDEIKALLENSGYGLEAIKNALGSSGAVKSVQRGVITLSAGTSVLSQAITIKSVNPDKCLVLVNESHKTINNSACLHGQSIASLTSTVLTLNCAPSPYVAINVSWQVVEFY